MTSFENFEYVKWGHCNDCDDDNASLYRPKAKLGVQVVFFTPLCKKCLQALLAGQPSFSNEKFQKRLRQENALRELTRLTEEYGGYDKEFDDK